MFEAAALNPGGQVPDAAQLMQEMAAGDPRMAMLMQLMQPQRGGEPSNDAGTPDDRDNLIAELSERLDASETRLTKMTRIARQLHEAGSIASIRLSRLAAALGACGICWGEDSACLGCRGRGKPGMIRPDPEMRAELFRAQSPVRDASQHCH